MRVMTGWSLLGAPARQWQNCPISQGSSQIGSHVHRIAVLALDQVVAFDLSIPAQVFGHPDERDRYALTVCAERPGPVPTSTGFEVVASRGLDALRDADTVVVPGMEEPRRRAPGGRRSTRSARPTRAARG